MRQESHRRSAKLKEVRRRDFEVEVLALQEGRHCPTCGAIHHPSSTERLLARELRSRGGALASEMLRCSVAKGMASACARSLRGDHFTMGQLRPAVVMPECGIGPNDDEDGCRDILCTGCQDDV